MVELQPQYFIDYHRYAREEYVLQRVEFLCRALCLTQYNPATDTSTSNHNDFQLTAKHINQKLNNMCKQLGIQYVTKQLHIFDTMKL